MARALILLALHRYTGSDAVMATTADNEIKIEMPTMFGLRTFTLSIS